MSATMTELASSVSAPHAPAATRTHPSARRARIRARPAALVALSAVVFTLCWFMKYNDPVGGYGGLADDHLFYAVRGWQILYGELPSRDFVDHGAPLTFWLSAAAQWLLGRSTGSEVLFSLTALALGVALTVPLVARASGSLIVALFGAAFQFMLGLRLYNYPKILVYALAIGALWAFADRPNGRRRTLLALVTTFGFLLRHDHGAYVAMGTLTLLMFLDHVPWQARMRHAGAYAGTVLVMLVPYLVYLQVYGGIVRHFATAAAWAVRDRDRAPLVWPTIDFSVAAPGSSPLGWLHDVTTASLEAFIFYSLLAWPIVALAVLARSRWAGRPEWRHGRAKLASVAALAIVTNLGFLRSPLMARFGDVSVPQTILFGWLLAVTGAAAYRALRSAPRGGAAIWIRGAAATAATVALFWMPAVLVSRVPELARRSAMLDGPEAFIERVKRLASMQAQSFALESWAERDAPGPMRLAYYIRDCTSPTDHVFVSQYMPQVAAMAQRPFAGGHADLRHGFYSTDADQRLTIQRLEKQSVPIAIVPPSAEYDTYRTVSFPLLGKYFDTRYEWFGEVDLGEGERVGILIDRSLIPAGVHPVVHAPCFAGVHDALRRDTSRTTPGT